MNENTLDREATTFLLNRAREGEADAVDDVLQLVGKRLLAFIRLRLGRNLRPHVEPSDVLQATLVRAFQRFDRFEGSSSETLMAWTMTIARNEIARAAEFHGRPKRRVADQVSLDDTGVEIPANYVRTEVSRIALEQKTKVLEAAMESLDPQHHEVILLRKYEELSFNEIGERMERSPEACRKLLARALTALSEEMLSKEG